MGGKAAGDKVATLKDVAKESRLTVGTVSRVLNNRGYISEKTRERVYQVMKELNYQPNEMARSLSTQKSKTIGVIIPKIEHPYFSKMISCLENAASEMGYKILLFNSQNNTEREDECIEMCKSGRVAGVVLCSGSFETEKFRELGFPLVTMERSIDEATAGVECDNYQGGVMAAELLIRKGCRHLVYIGGDSVGEQISMPADFRKTAFIDVCQKNQLDYLVADTDKMAFDSMNYYDFLRDFLEKHPDTDGMFADSDVIAAYVLQVCHDMGICVPEQLKIVGFDDVNIAALTTPGITTIHQPIEQMADQAIRIISEIDEGKVVPTKTVFPVTLVERGTV